jgi:membrane protease YdiL (CAAX protease family)
MIGLEGIPCGFSMFASGKGKNMAMVALFLFLWCWLGVLALAVLFGLTHLYQGQSGVATFTLVGLILATVYLHFGRVWPLMISHYLHNALQIILLVYLIRSGAI